MEKRVQIVNLNLQTMAPKEVKESCRHSLICKWRASKNIDDTTHNAGQF